MKKLYFICFCLLALISCRNSGDSKSSENFQVNGELKGKTITVPVNILMPSKVFIKDDKLLVYDRKGDGFLKTFQLPEVKHLYNWGKIGKGPDEFTFVDAETITPITNGIELLDNFKVKLFEVGDTSMSLIKTKEKLIFPQDGYPVNHLERMSDKIYFADNMSKEETEHVMIDVDNPKNIKKFGKYPDSDIKFTNPMQRNTAFYKMNTSKPDGSRFTVFYLYQNRMKIYDKEGQIIANVETKPVNGARKFSPENSNENTLYFAGPFGTDNYIYVIQVAKTKAEFDKNMGNFNPSLQIWDWDGNPIANYTLDRPVTGFAISEKYKKLYGVSFANMNDIYEFDISEFLNR